MTSVGDPLVGRLLDGRYQITQRLARGGMATVYIGTDVRLTRTVAVKVMHVGLGDDAEFARKFDREARSAAKLSHPNVVSVFDQGHDNGRPYIVMEYVEGRTLRDILNHEAPLPPQRALEIIEPVLGALAAAHEAGLVHRDVKPENVLISERGQVKVVDFGLAKAISSQTSTATQGLLIGTVSYLPPELVLSGKAGPRSDVYSAGVVLFEMLTGRKPHQGETPIQVAYAHVHNDVPAPSAFRTASHIPPYLDALVAGATARNPEARPHDGRVFLSQVRRVKVALREGLVDDLELTQDLSVLRRSDLAQALPAGVDPGSEITQLVPPPGGPPVSPPQIVQQPRIAHQGGLTPTSPPTFRDAPPPATPHAPAPAPAAQFAPGERLANRRDKEARRRRRGWVVLLLVLMLTVTAALVGWYLTEGRFTAIPSLTSLPKAEAATVAGNEGLQISFVDDFSETVASGLVIDTDPAAGSKVRDGGAFTATVSKGPQRFAMPKVAGTTQASATGAINDAHLVLGDVSRSYHDTVAKGVVLKASHPVGAELKAGTSVDLSVSKGPKPIKITDYRGKSAATAKAALTKAGFKVTVNTIHSDEVRSGLVISQSPREGSGVKGDTISMKQSLGPVMVTIPNVRSMGVDAAKKVMTKAGFKSKVQPVSVNYIGIGYVVYSKPGARSQAAKGSTITLYVV
ncbi:MAG: Stk1 family PASTA domain-containing Ser/Thr kinase [Microlunatus sp.]|nr:Stk1 family PASTA domain-containing Ser/Thr kinase [Microlunatus sp.]